MIIVTPVFAACYFPGGTLATNDTPCRDDKKNSVCCRQGYACLSNGLCQATGEEPQKPGATEFVRGGCTDKSWRSSNCPLFCMNPDKENTAGGMGLAKCENAKQDVYYCINSDQEDVSCEDSIGVIFFPGEHNVTCLLLIRELTLDQARHPLEQLLVYHPTPALLRTR